MDAQAFQRSPLAKRGAFWLYAPVALAAGPRSPLEEDPPEPINHQQAKPARKALRGRSRLFVFS